MRLIDADKLREKLIIDYEVRETYFGEILLKEIDESPTVENITVFCENADEKTIEDLKAELQSVIEARPQGEYVDISKLRLMTVEECEGHTIDYARGWKACIEWIKRGCDKE